MNATAPARGVLAEILGFIRRHLWHLLVLIPGALLVIALHEAAHAAAVVAQGGTVLGFHWFPSANEWGYVTFQFPPGRIYSDAAVSLAPYAGWLFVAAATSAVAWLRPPRSYRVASAVFIWGFVVPLADVAHAAFPWLMGHDNDFRCAFGPPGVWALPGVAAVSAFCVAWGVPLQRGLYGDLRLSLPAYLVLSTATLAGVAAAGGCLGWAGI